jgi:YegS/Rv2252/BmrU family lipid kinase
MQKIVVFYNTEASRAGKPVWKESIQKILFRSELKFIPIQHSNQIKEAIEESIRDGVEVIISIGGDGTVNLLIQNLIHTNIKYLVVPAGTANDLARELGLNRNIEKSIEAVRRNQVKKIDLIKINNRLMATNGGIGLGATLTKEINELRKAHPRFKYLMRLLKNRTYDLFLAINIFKPNLTFYNVKINCDGKESIYRATMIVILNQEKIAGKLKIIEGSTNNDGTFEVAVFAHSNRLSLSQCIGQIVLGQVPKNDPSFITFQAKALTISSLDGNPVPFWGDGEVFNLSSTYEIEIIPEALQVYYLDKKR